MKFKQSQYINQIICGHALEILRKLPSNIVQCCITSPPYWGLRLYSGKQNQIWGGKKDCKHKWAKDSCKCGAYYGALGLEPIHDCLSWARSQEPCAVCYVCHLRTIFAQVKRVLRDDGIFWLNLGDCYAGSGKAGTSIEYQRGHTQFGQKERQERLGLPIKPPKGLKPKDLCMMPSRVAMALQTDGWYLRSIIPWLKRNTTPESVRDRPTTANEWILLLTKSGKPQYWTHPRKRGTRQNPKPDYIYVHKRTREQMPYQPVSNRILKKFWMRKNLWHSHQYFYDIDAIRLPHKTSNDRNISDHSQKYKGKFDKKICETVSSPRARQNRNGYTPSYYHPTGRNRRTTDWWYESLDLIIKNQQAYLKHLENIKETQGLLIDKAGAPLGFNVNTKPFKQAHFAVFPPTLIKPCILAGTSPKACAHCGAPYTRITKRTRQNKSYCAPTCNCNPQKNTGKCLILDPFIGSGTVALEALNNNRAYLGIEISKEYTAMSRQRIKQATQQASLFSSY